MYIEAPRAEWPAPATLGTTSEVRSTRGRDRRNPRAGPGYASTRMTSDEATTLRSASSSGRRCAASAVWRRGRAAARPCRGCSVRCSRRAIARSSSVLPGRPDDGRAMFVTPRRSEELAHDRVEREPPGRQRSSLEDREPPRRSGRRLLGDGIGVGRARAGTPPGSGDLDHALITGIDPARPQPSHLDDGDELRGRTIIVATGVTWRHLAIPGIER